MNSLLSLKKKSDAVLISDLKDLVVHERQVLTEILHYIKEVSERKLYLARGFSSLFSFLTEEMGYSEAAAHRRVQAMRLLRDVPEVEEKIEAGSLSLSVVSQVQGYFRKEDQKRRVQKTQKLSKEEKLDLVHAGSGGKYMVAL